MKTYSLPSRAWTHSAGRETHGADSPFFGGFGFVGAAAPDRRHRRRLVEQMRLAFRPFGKFVALLKRIRIVSYIDVLRLGPGQRFERQTIAQRRIAGDQEQSAATPETRAGWSSAARRIGGDAAQRQDVADVLPKPCSKIRASRARSMGSSSLESSGSTLTGSRRSFQR